MCKMQLFLNYLSHLVSLMATCLLLLNVNENVIWKLNLVTRRYYEIGEMTNNNFDEMPPYDFGEQNTLVKLAC